jgi:hypothetical protein
MPPKAPTSKMPPKERVPAALNGAKWGSSDAKKLMAQDIIDGLIPKEGPVDIDQVYKTLYAGHKLFANFPYSRERYKARLDSFRKTVKTFKYWGDFDSKAIASDLLICPPSAFDVRGEPRWEGSAAQEQLEEDVAAGLDVGKTPMELHKTRALYQEFSLTKFRKHLDQMRQARKSYVDNGKKYTKNIHGSKELSRLNVL